jgi:hypothetical protein
MLPDVRAAHNSGNRQGIPFIHHRSGAHAWHCDAVTGKVKGGPILKRITPSEAEQKLLVPVSLETGMATTANFLHTCL